MDWRCQINLHNWVFSHYIADGADRYKVEVCDRGQGCTAKRFVKI